MNTQVFRVTRVLSAAGSPVARLHAVDAQGHELQLELPVAAVQGATGQALVLQWSLHAVPEVMTPAAVQAEPATSTAPVTESTESPAVTAELFTSHAVDEAFMALMARCRRGASASAQPLVPPPERVPDRDIKDEFNALLGSAQRKG
jgi:hypothetical protein